MLPIFQVDLSEMTPLRWDHANIIKDTWRLHSGDMCELEKGRLGAQKCHIFMPLVHLLLVGVDVITIICRGNHELPPILLEERENIL